MSCDSMSSIIESVIAYKDRRTLSCLSANAAVPSVPRRARAIHDRTHSAVFIEVVVTRRMSWKRQVNNVPRGPKNTKKELKQIWQTERLHSVRLVKHLYCDLITCTLSPSLLSQSL